MEWITPYRSVMNGLNASDVIELAHVRQQVFPGHHICLEMFLGFVLDFLHGLLLGSYYEPGLLVSLMLHGQSSTGPSYFCASCSLFES